MLTLTFYVLICCVHIRLQELFKHFHSYINSLPSSIFPSLFTLFRILRIIRVNWTSPQIYHLFSPAFVFVFIFPLINFLVSSCYLLCFYHYIISNSSLPVFFSLLYTRFDGVSYHPVVINSRFGLFI